jgi:hypothetical protein
MNFLDPLIQSPPSGGQAGAFEMLFGLGLSLALNLVIAGVYRATYRGTRYSQDYVQTLILIGVVTTILISVVNGNGPVAFGMFAAFSVIRFRRTLGQSRDLAFVLFAMAVGMVVGARLYPMAIGITVLVCITIIVMVRINAFRPSRSSHFITLRATSDIDCERLARPILDRHTESSELLSLSSTQAGMSNEIRYGIQMKPGAHLGTLLDELLIMTENNRVLIHTATEQETEI